MPRFPPGLFNFIRRNLDHGSGTVDPSALEEAHNKKIVAGILGILLGGLGIHKFYLGYTTAGIIMLVVSIVSCGFVAPIISIIGLIEGILYLTKSDEEFYRTYIAGQHPWF